MLLEPSLDEEVVHTRQRQTRLRPEQIGQLVRAYEEGATVYELAARFDCSRQTISKKLREAGVRMRLESLTTNQVDEAVRLYESGLSLQKVGDQVGATARTIQLRLRERQVRMRDSHGRY